MVIRQTPNHKEKYIQVNNLVGVKLQQNGFYPKYMDYNFLYFTKSKEIIEFMKTEGLESERV